jgi:hypothetical protein
LFRDEELARNPVFYIVYGVPSYQHDAMLAANPLADDDTTPTYSGLSLHYRPWLKKFGVRTPHF